MLNKIKSATSLNISNAQGWRTNRKIIVIESDDWGAIRTSNNKALKALKKLNVKVEDCHYTKYDALASAEGVEAFLGVLYKVKNRDGVPPVLTANTIVANPDFKRIKETNYRDYFWEDFTTSLQNYPEHGSSFLLWQEGMDRGLFHPQFHGREHLNISRWMPALQDGDEITRKAFDSIRGEKIILTEEIKSKLLKYYKPSNIELEQLLNRDLSEVNYY